MSPEDEEDKEEREMETEALESIFEEEFEIVEENKYLIRVSPEADEAFVKCRIEIEVYSNYPSRRRPRFQVVDSEGLAKSQLIEIEEIAKESAEESAGVVCIFESVSAVKEWLTDHNVAGQDDDSMYAAMLRREENKEKKPDQVLEVEDAREAARENRLRNGTPFTQDRFQAWWASFQAQLFLQNASNALQAAAKTTKPTGKDLFTRGTAVQVQDDDQSSSSSSSSEYEDHDQTPAVPIDHALFQDDDDVLLDDLDEDDDDEED